MDARAEALAVKLRQQRAREAEEHWQFWEGPDKHKWSALDDARVIALAAIGAPANLAALILGRSQGAVLVRWRQKWRLSIGKPKPKPCTPDRIAQVRELIEVRGLSYSEAARALGISSGAVSGIVHRHIRKTSATPRGLTP